MAVDETGVETAGAKFDVLGERLEKRRVDPRADHDGVAQCRRQAIERLATRRRLRDDFRDHRIVVGRHRVARSDTTVDPGSPCLAGSANTVMRSGDGRKPMVRVSSA